MVMTIILGKIIVGLVVEIVLLRSMYDSSVSVLRALLATVAAVIIGNILLYFVVNLFSSDQAVLEIMIRIRNNNFSNIADLLALSFGQILGLIIFLALPRPKQAI